MNSADTITDPREAPAYVISEAAHYLRMPTATLRSWFTSQSQIPAVLPPAQNAPTTLSFFNLVEAHVVNSIRRDHVMPLQTLRKAIGAVYTTMPDCRHPLIDRRFTKDGLASFVKGFGVLTRSSTSSRTIPHVVERHLSCIVWAPDGLPKKFFPFTGLNPYVARQTIVIDPCIGFGRPVISGSGISARELYDRFTAGETIATLSEDFACTVEEVEDAIRSESDA